MSNDERQAGIDARAWEREQGIYSPVSAAEEISCAKWLEQEAAKHAFTCRKCGCHVVNWRNDVFTCNKCGEPHKPKSSVAPLSTLPRLTQNPAMVADVAAPLSTP